MFRIVFTNLIAFVIKGYLHLTGLQNCSEKREKYFFTFYFIEKIFYLPLKIHMKKRNEYI
jgi:hypothetical protein